MADDAFDIEHLPRPNEAAALPQPNEAAALPPPTDTATGDSAALTPEVVEPDGAHQGRRKAALTSTRPAEEALRKAAPKAVSTLIRCLDSDNQWIQITAARAIIERVIPVVVEEDPENRAILVFPSGSKMAVMALPVEEQQALATLRRTVE